MRIAILYNEPQDSSNASDQDVLVQKQYVARALSEAGHESVEIGCTLNLDALSGVLVDKGVDCAFNLVESLGGTDRLAAMVPMLLDALGIAYTGTAALPMLETTDKPTVKRRLRALGLPTPDWFDGYGDEGPPVSGTFIVKARFEHASIGMDDSAIVTVQDADELRRIIRARSEACGHSMFAERFVAGREFNIAMLADESGKGRVLSPAEIDFSAFPQAKPRIVGYAAKWAEHSFEFNATPRTFSFGPGDRPLLEGLTQLSEDVWNAFGLGGYARVDFRVDEEGNPWILEINTNPCLSPDAGFAAALTQSGYTFTSAVELMIRNARRSNRR